MTFDNLLTLPLQRRIERLRRHAGSHDKLAAELGTTRQTIIGWEKGAQPSEEYRDKLAALTGLPADSFTRTVAEQQLWDVTETRLEALEARVDRLYAETARGFEELGHQRHGLGVQEEDRPR